MALTKTDNFYGFTTDIYVKIAQALVTETGKDEEGKLYSVRLALNWYTNSTKEYQFSQTDTELKDLRIDELNFDSYYEKLKQDEKFSTFIDA